MGDWDKVKLGGLAGLHWDEAEPVWTVSSATVDATAATPWSATGAYPHSTTSGNHGVATVSMQQSFATVEGQQGSQVLHKTPPFKGVVATPLATVPCNTPETASTEEEEPTPQTPRDDEIDRVEERGTCRSCGANIVWTITKNGKRMPVDFSTGISHFATCPQAGKWRKR